MSLQSIHIDSFFDDIQSGDNDYDCTDIEPQDILGQLNLDPELLKPVDEVSCEQLSDDKFSVEKMLLTFTSNDNEVPSTCHWTTFGS